MKGMRARLAGQGKCVPGLHRVSQGEQVVFEAPGGQELPMLAVIIATPQGMPLVLAQSEQVDREMLMLVCLQRLMLERRQREESPLAKAGFVVPAGVSMPVRETTDADPLQ